MADNIEISLDPILVQMETLLLQIEDEEALDAMKVAISLYKEGKSIDKSLLERLQIWSNAHGTPVITGRELPKFVNENSIIIYFKSAKRFKVYKSSQIKNDLNNHLRNDFKKEKNMYEVVPNDVPQKIVIVCEKDVIPRIPVIKKYVIEYMSTEGVEINESNIRAFENDGGMVEIMLNGLYVQDKKEGDKIVSDLMAFIERKERSTALTKKMNQKSEYNEFEGTTMVYMPNCKTELDHKSPEITDSLVRNLDNCKHVKTGNIYIGNLTVVGGRDVNVTIGGNHVVQNVLIANTDNIEDFINHIKNNRPEWYIENDWINQETLKYQYEEMFGRAPKTFYPRFKNRLYSQQARHTNNETKKREYCVLLLKFDDIE